MPSDRSGETGSDAQRISEQAYREKIIARQCLNMLVDIKSALSRQNKMLELLIDQQNATRVQNAAE